jgi:3'-phosphoadenosine 5'-phosphosulfate sulfotransferase
MGKFRVNYRGRISKTYTSLEDARAAKRFECAWSGRIGEIQERIGDEWVRAEDQRIGSDVQSGT